MCCYCCSVAKLYVTLCALVDCSMQFSLSVTISQNLLKFIFIESVMLSHHLILCCPLLLSPSFFLIIRVFSEQRSLYSIAFSFVSGLFRTDGCSGSSKLSFFFLKLAGTSQTLSMASACSFSLCFSPYLQVSNQ